MFEYIARRILLLILTLIGISIFVFLLIRIIPGDAIDVKLGTEVSALTESQKSELQAYFGLDKPLHVQYWIWLNSTLHGNLGYSIRTGRPVLSEILDRFPVTLEITFFGVVIGSVVGIITGIISALKPSSVYDWISRIGALLGLSVPQFWLATLIILILSLNFRGLLSIESYVNFVENPLENIKQIIFPALCLSVGLAASVMRMARSSMLEVMREDYIRTAKSKGLAHWTVISVHALKNALIPVITVIGIQAGYMLGGAVVIENIFSLPGLGRLTLQSIYQRDYAMIQGAIIFIALNFILINLFVDIIYAYVDPRIRYE